MVSLSITFGYLIFGRALPKYSYGPNRKSRVNNVIAQQVLGLMRRKKGEKKDVVDSDRAQSTILLRLVSPLPYVAFLYIGSWRPLLQMAVKINLDKAYDRLS